LQVDQAEIPVDGLADPLRIDSARVEIDGARVTIDRLRGAAGKLASPATTATCRERRIRIACICARRIGTQPMWKRNACCRCAADRACWPAPWAAPRCPIG
jgi:hypothetical protein